MTLSGLPRWSIACMYAAGAILAGLLLIQHWIHVAPYVYGLVFLVCPLMHLFMHHGHGRHHHETPKAGSGPAP